MKKVILVCLVLPFVITSFAFCSLVSDFNSSNDYIESSGWNCSEDEFHGEYFKLIEDKVNYLETKNNIDCSCEVDNKGKNFFIITLYNQEMTCQLSFSSYTDYGMFEASLFFYGDSSQDLDNYDSQEKYVEFLNEITHFAAYDINKDINIFEDAYNRCVDGKRAHHQLIYEDSLIGTLMYNVSKECKGFGQYSKFETENTDALKCNYFYCRSLLSNYHGLSGDI